MGLFDKLFGKKDIEKNNQISYQTSVPTEALMTSQLPALYLSENNQAYRNIYLRKLMSIGFNKTNAEKMFDFECEIIRKHGKKKVPQFEPDSNIIWLNFERRKALLFGRVSYCDCTNEFYNYYRTLYTPLLSLSSLFLNDNA